MSDAETIGLLRSLKGLVDSSTKRLDSEDSKVKGSGLLTVVSIVGLVIWLLWIAVEDIVSKAGSRVEPLWNSLWKDAGTGEAPDFWAIMILAVILIVGSKLWKWVFVHLSETVGTSLGQILLRLAIFLGVSLFAALVIPSMVAEVSSSMENREIWIAIAILAPFFMWGFWMLFDGSPLFPGKARYIAMGTFGVSIAIVGFITWTYWKTPVYAFNLKGEPQKMVSMDGKHQYDINPKDCIDVVKYPDGCTSPTGEKLRAITQGDITDEEPRALRILQKKKDQFLDWIEGVGNKETFMDKKETTQERSLVGKSGQMCWFETKKGAGWDVNRDNEMGCFHAKVLGYRESPYYISVEYRDRGGVTGTCKWDVREDPEYGVWKQFGRKNGGDCILRPQGDKMFTGTFISYYTKAVYTPGDIGKYAIEFKLP